MLQSHPVQALEPKWITIRLHVFGRFGPGRRRPRHPIDLGQKIIQN